MEKVSVAMDEQETTINLVPARVSNEAEVYTSDPVMDKRLHKLAEAYPEDVQIVREDKYGTEYIIPAKWITIRKPRSIAMTDEMRAAVAERLQRARQARA